MSATLAASRGGSLLAAPTRARVTFFALLLFIAVVYLNPSNLFPALGDHGYAKIVAGLALVGLGAAWLLHDRPIVLGGTVGACLFLFFAIVGSSVLWSLWHALSFTTFTDGIKYLAIYVLIANIVDDHRRACTVVHALALATLAPAIGAIWSWSRGEHLVEGDRAAWIGLFGNPNDLAYHLSIGVALTLGARELTQRRWVRLFYVGALATDGFALLLTQSRGGLLATGAVVGLWLIRSVGTRHRRAAVSLLVVVLLLACYAPEATRRRAGTTLQYQEDASTQGRIDAWRTGVRVIEDRPLGGVGAGAFLLAWPIYAPGDAGPARTAHNTFVQLASETGVPSLLLFLGAIAAAIVGLQRAARRAELDVPARATQVGLCGFLIASSTGGLAYSWPLYLLLGLGAALTRLDRSSETT